MIPTKRRFRRSIVSAKRPHICSCGRPTPSVGPRPAGHFDSGPFITQGLSPTTGKPVRYYNFDVQTTMPAPVYVLYREGEDTPVADQLDIIDTLPGEKGYNDFRQVWKVTVPKDYVANTITDAAALIDAGYKMERPVLYGTCRSCPTSRTRACD